MKQHNKQKSVYLLGILYQIFWQYNINVQHYFRSDLFKGTTILFFLFIFTSISYKFFNINQNKNWIQLKMFTFANISHFIESVASVALQESLWNILLYSSVFCIHRHITSIIYFQYNNNLTEIKENIFPEIFLPRKLCL